MSAYSRTTPVAAFAFMACGATGLTLGDFFIKMSVGSGVSFATLIVFAWPITAIGLILLAHYTGGLRHHLTPKNPLPLLGRTMLLLVMSWLNITSLTLNPYAQHAMLFQLSPVFAVLISTLLFAEIITKRMMFVLSMCILGTWLVLRPDTDGVSLTLFFAIAAAFMNAVTNTFISAYNKAATALGYTFYAVNGVFLIALPYWLVADQQVPSLLGLGWIQLSAIFSVAGLALVGLAFLKAQQNVGRVSMMLYVQIPVAVILGWAVFKEAPPFSAILGSILIGTAGVLALLRPKSPSPA